VCKQKFDWKIGNKIDMPLIQQKDCKNTVLKMKKSVLNQISEIKSVQKCKEHRPLNDPKKNFLNQIMKTSLFKNAKNTDP
jgi:hypothetical protein